MGTLTVRGVRCSFIVLFILHDAVLFMACSSPQLYIFTLVWLVTNRVSMDVTESHTAVHH